MMRAYDRIYLERSRISLGRMLDYAVYDLKYELSEFWTLFTASHIARQFERGDVSVIAGMSGIELALMVTGKEQAYAKPIFSDNRSPEYWTGWALAYYQWQTCLSFTQITEFISIEEIRMMYSPYHEMDIRQFCDKLSEMYDERKQLTNLKCRRLAVGISQSQLAEYTGIPVRTIQQYEQGQKTINNARASYVIALSRVLCCDPDLLLERELS